MPNNSIDDSKLSKFQVRTAIYGNGGHLCDGFVLGAIVPALPIFARSHEMTPLMSGLIGSSALFGVFLGSAVFGMVADRIGRRKVFLLGLSAFVVLSLAQFFVTGPESLFAIRLLLGVFIGAEYAVATTLVAEFAPKKYRATFLALGPAMWTVGYVLAIFVGTLMESLGDDAWRWILMTSAIPSLVFLLLRRNTPESPRWLAAQGRTAEALEILRAHYSAEATVEDLKIDEGAGQSGTSALKTLLSNRYRKRLAFGCLFWICQVVPYFGVFMFLPSIITSLGIESGFWQTQSVNLFLLVGGVVGILTINLTGRRTYTLISFSLLAASTLAIGLWQSAPTVAVIGLFAVFALVSSAMSALDTIYPSEMFPTEVRSTANGICVAASRIGAAVGVLLLPLGVSALGAHTTVLITAGIAALGLLVSIAWAPETAGKSLGSVADLEEDPNGASSAVHAL
ncbi:MFS transporter [Arthrobacter ginkgonis]|uniref:MFS transporter n=1 Tax=Arthrobacter ginkgonis TaxID=1630594 RepID=A0ABP7CTJ6_9MICC